MAVTMGIMDAGAGRGCRRDAASKGWVLDLSAFLDPRIGDKDRRADDLPGFVAPELLTLLARIHSLEDECATLRAKEVLRSKATRKVLLATRRFVERSMADPYGKFEKSLAAFKVAASEKVG